MKRRNYLKRAAALSLAWVMAFSGPASHLTGMVVSAEETAATETVDTTTADAAAEEARRAAEEEAAQKAAEEEAARKAAEEEAARKAAEEEAARKAAEEEAARKAAEEEAAKKAAEEEAARKAAEEEAARKAAEEEAARKAVEEEAARKAAEEEAARKAAEEEAVKKAAEEEAAKQAAEEAAKKAEDEKKAVEEPAAPETEKAGKEDAVSPDVPKETQAPVTEASEEEEKVIAQISYKAGKGGTVSAAEEKADLADTLSLHGSKAEADEGYAFINWTDASGKEVGEDAQFTPSADQLKEGTNTFTANFEIYPAVKLQSETFADGTVVTVEVPEGTLPKDIKFRVKEVELESVISQLLKALNYTDEQITQTKTFITDTEELSWKDFVSAFEIHFYMEQEPEADIDPIKPVKVTFSNLAIGRKAEKKEEFEAFFLKKLSDEKAVKKNVQKTELAEDTNETLKAQVILETKEFPYYILADMAVLSRALKVAAGSKAEIETETAEEETDEELEAGSETETGEYPETHLSMTMEDGTVITVDVPEGALPAGVQMRAEKVVSVDMAAQVLQNNGYNTEDSYTYAQEMINLGLEDVFMRAYDICFYLKDKQDIEIEPLIPVNVQIHYTDFDINNNEKLRVYHVDDEDGSLDRQKITLGTDKGDLEVSFTSDQFSTYITTKSASGQGNINLADQKQFRLAGADVPETILKGDLQVGLAGTGSFDTEYKKLFKTIEGAELDYTAVLNVKEVFLQMIENEVTQAGGQGITLDELQERFGTIALSDLDCSFTVVLTAEKGLDLSEASFDLVNENKGKFEMTGMSKTMSADGQSVTLIITYDKDHTIKNYAELADDVRNKTDELLQLNIEGVKVADEVSDQYLTIRGSVSGSFSATASVLFLSIPFAYKWKGEQDHEVKAGKYGNDTGEGLDYIIENGVEDGAGAGNSDIWVTVTPVTDVRVTKVWEDEKDKDGLRPENISIALLADNAAAKDADGAAVEAHTLVEEDTDGDWTFLFRNLPVMNKDGKRIVYTAQETLPAGWTLGNDQTTWTKGGEKASAYTMSSAVSSAKNETQITFTNTHEVKTIDLTVVKSWDDDENRDGIRPDSVTVTLNDAAKTKVVLNASNKWTDSVKGLPIFADGEKISYVWTETPIDGYTLSKTEVSKDGLTTTLTNTHKPETVDLKVAKVWDDKDDKDGIRPKKVTVTLNDAAKTQIILEASKKWAGSVIVPKYADGKEISYAWSEEKIDGYTLSKTEVSEDGLTTIFTNTHTPETEKPETVDVKVVKVWDDKNNKDGIRPASVTVTLNDAAKTEVVLKASNKWTATVFSLPKYADGKEITYKWTEEKVDGYKLSKTEVSKDGLTTTLTNSHEPETEPEPEPKLVTDDPPVSKKITGDKPEKKSSFTFRLKALNASYPMPEGSKDGVKSVTIEGEGKIEFGVITFDKPGTYNYMVTETPAAITGYTFDKSIYMIKYVVTEKDGALQVVRTFLKDNKEIKDISITFENKYKKSGSGGKTPAKGGGGGSSVGGGGGSAAKTGDSSPIGLLLGILGGSLAAIILALALLLRRRKR